MHLSWRELDRTGLGGQYSYERNYMVHDSGIHHPGFHIHSTPTPLLTLFDRPTNAKATYFLLPYCVWLCFETYLNAGVWWLNRKSKIIRK